jgi:hypothetical protein
MIIPLSLPSHRRPAALLDPAAGKTPPPSNRRALAPVRQAGCRSAGTRFLDAETEPPKSPPETTYAGRDQKDPKRSTPQEKRKSRREPKSVSVSSISTSAAAWGAATASSRQSPTEATLAEVVTAGELRFGAGAIDRLSISHNFEHSG